MSLLTPRMIFLSGLIVALALVPEAVAFALLTDIDPLVGLYAAFTIGLVTSIIGGTMAIIHFLPRFTKIIPSTLTAIIIGGDADTNNINAEFKNNCVIISIPKLAKVRSLVNKIAIQ